MRIDTKHYLLLTSCLSAALPYGAFANPQGGQVVAGSASITETGSVVDVHQSTQRAIIDWRSFDIAPNETTRFHQPSASSHTLNRVNSMSRSVIEGTIEANGNITIVNPNGVFFSRGSVVDVGGLTATTADTSNANFMAGKAQHDVASANTAAEIRNEGNITVKDAGLATLVAPSVVNDGVITAKLGKVQLASGDTFVMDLGGDGQLQVAVNQATLQRQLVQNSGRISADGGYVALTAAGARDVVDSLITNTGIIEAKEGRVTIDGTFVAMGGTVSTSGTKGGAIDIKAKQLSLAENIEAKGTAGAGGTVNIHSTAGTLETSTSRIDVSGSSGGGSITHISGGTILTSGTYLANSGAGIGGAIDISAKDSVGMLRSTLHANGATGGGRVRVGGEYQGGKYLSVDELLNAASVVINDGSSLQAKAIGVSGDGGTVIVWSDETTLMHGAVDVAPSSLAGSGGFVELSSAGSLTTSANVITGVGSRQGHLLLDPKDITIANTAGYNPLALLMGRGYAGANQFNMSGLEANDYAGLGVSIDGNRMIVAAPYGDGFGNVASQSGEVYLFSFTNDSFAGAALEGVVGKGYVGGKNINLTQLDANDSMGHSTSLDGNRLAIGVWGASGFGNTAAVSGEVYLFSFTDSTFSGGTLEATIGKGYVGGKNYNMTMLDNGDYFGSAVSLDGNRLAVGAEWGDGFGNTVANSGEVYLFSFADANFNGATIEATIGKGYVGGKNINLAALDVGDAFGDTLSLSGNLLVVGAQYGDGFANVASSSGDVYLFSFTDSNFSGGVHEGNIGRGYVGGKNVNVTELTANDWFGNGVALSGNRLAIGVPGDDGFGNAFGDTGAVYVYTFDNNFDNITRERIVGKGYVGANDVNMSGLENSDWFGWKLAIDNTRLAVGAPTADGSGNGVSASGEVYAFNFGGDSSINSATSYASVAGSNVTIAPSALLAVLNTGTAVTLQANNDIFVNNDIIANNGGGNGGWLTLQAGRSILLNANITTDNGNLTLIGNDNLASGVVDAHRDAGAAVITQALGTSIDAGTGAVNIELRAGTGKTNSAAGDITLRSITAGSVFARSFSAVSDIIINNILNLSGAGTALELVAGDDIINNVGAGVFNLTGGGRFLTWSDDPLEDTGEEHFSAASTKRYNRNYGDAVEPAGNIRNYSVAPTLTITPNNTQFTYGDASSVAGTYAVTGWHMAEDEAAHSFGGAATFATSYVQGNNAGTNYTVTNNGSTLSSGLNYQVSYVPSATLTVNKADLRVKAVDLSYTAGSGVPVVTFLYEPTDFKLGQNAATAGLIGAPTVSNIDWNTVSAGTYAMQVGFGGLISINYSFSEFMPRGVLSVAAARPSTSLLPDTVRMVMNDARILYTGSAPFATSGTNDAGGTDSGRRRNVNSNAGSSTQNVNLYDAGNGQMVTSMLGTISIDPVVMQAFGLTYNSNETGFQQGLQAIFSGA